MSELVIDCQDPVRLAAFWCEVLGFVELEQVDGSIESGPQAGVGGLQPTIVFGPSPEPKAGKLEPVDPALHGVPLLVPLRAEGVRAAA
ncbi:MAG: VOC family protein [Streptosporangiaceae bacterium]